MFWMLEAPMFRRYDVPAVRAPLFQDRGSRSRKLNCLLIQGDVSGFNAAPPLDRPFVAVEAARDEVLELEDFLQENEAKFGIGTVKRIQHAGGPGATPGFINELERALSRRTWDLIHYAGHCFGEPQDLGGRVYLVFGPGREGVVEADMFARWVRKSRFLFLSTCQSAGAHFVLQMVKQTVPAIVGYRWTVDDLHARLFARQFYASLFSDRATNRYIEYAFLHAKRALHESRLPAPAWAAPMLVMQSLRRDAA
jgi:hypothetical protein